MLDTTILRALRGKEYTVTVGVELTGTIDVKVYAMDDEDAMEMAQQMVTMEEAMDSNNLKLEVDSESAVCYNE